MRIVFGTLVLASMAAIPGGARGPDGVPAAIDYSTHPGSNGPYYRGRLFSLKGTRTHPMGWLFSGGTAAVEIVRGTWSVPLGITFGQVVFADEWRRISYVVGTQAGVCAEAYLGRGYVGRLDLRAPVPHARISLDWFPFDGASLSLGLDLVRMRLHAEWMFEDDSPFWPGLP
jgi:hypothetical protein